MILDALQIAEKNGFGFQVVKQSRFVTDDNLILSLALGILKEKMKPDEYSVILWLLYNTQRIETVMKKHKETGPLKTGCVPLSSAWRNLDFYLQATDHILNVVLIIKDKQ